MIKCVDFFCGCGGTSAGLMQAGIQIVVGIDNDSDAATTFRSNFPQASLLKEDIRGLSVTDLESHISRDEKDIWLFSACAPCQPFTQHRKRNVLKDDRTNLLSELVRFVDAFLPDLLFVENVPWTSLTSRVISGRSNELLDFLDSRQIFDCTRGIQLLGLRCSPEETQVRADWKPTWPNCIPWQGLMVPALPILTTRRSGSGSATYRQSMQASGTSVFQTTKLRHYQF